MKTLIGCCFVSLPDHSGMAEMNTASKQNFPKILIFCAVPAGLIIFLSSNVSSISSLLSGTNLLSALISTLPQFSVFLISFPIHSL